MSMPFGESEDINNLGGDSGNTDGINPAWNKILEAIPEDARESVIPELKAWDTGVQQKIQSVHSEWAPYEFLRKENIGDEDVRVALGVVRAIQEDPEAVYKSLAESYGFGADPGQGATGSQNAQPDLSQIPEDVRKELETLKGGYNTVAEILLQQKNEKEAQESQAAADAALQNDLARLKSAHGEFDEGYVLAQMQTGMSGDDAVKTYNAMVEKILTERSRPQPPRLLGSGGGSGGFPGNGKLDPTKMDASQTKNMVAQYLAAQAAQNK